MKFKQLIFLSLILLAVPFSAAQSLTFEETPTAATEDQVSLSEYQALQDSLNSQKEINLELQKKQTNIQNQCSRDSYQGPDKWIIVGSAGALILSFFLGYSLAK